MKVEKVQSAMPQLVWACLLGQWMAVSLFTNASAPRTGLRP
jgi:hypothetical protein